MSGATVKICGLMNEQVLDAVKDLPIDQIGFIFAPSRRQLTPQRVGELTRHLRGLYDGNRRAPLTVGVFVSPTMEELEEAVKHAGLDVLQLHGGENAEFCRAIKARFPSVGLFKVVSIGKDAPSYLEGRGGRFDKLEPFAGLVDAILLDTHDPTIGGGTGRAFDWSVIPAYAKWARGAGIRLIAAGGLDPDNVGELIRTYRPDGVDVSSGVETNGVKDPAKIIAFVERVKAL